MRSAFLMEGTSRRRSPSGAGTSMARPKATWAGAWRVGLPASSVVYETFMEGISARASTTAHPMRWVKETLPPWVWRRWPLMTARFSMRTLAGMSRAEVAVGIDSEASMFRAVRAAAPLMRESASRPEPSSGAPVRRCSVRRA